MSKNKYIQDKNIERLQAMQKEQTAKRISFYPIAVGVVAFLILILYIIISRHCLMDMPLLVVLCVLSMVMIFLSLSKGRALTGRIDQMLEEREQTK